jgi:hypothetical protein
VWSAGRQCFGVPSCPRGFAVSGNGCVHADPTAVRADGTCARGKVPKSGHCCWPEQVWTEGGCLGVPACPRGYLLKARDCVPRPAPPEEDAVETQ